MASDFTSADPAALAASRNGLFAFQAAHLNVQTT